MKRLIFTIFILVQVAVMAPAQGFLPILEEGKEWVVEYRNRDKVTGYGTLVVEGDTIVNDVTCKRIVVYELHDGIRGVRKGESNCKMEEGSKLAFVLDYDRWNAYEVESFYPMEVYPKVSILDMSLDKGDKLRSCTIEDVDYIRVNGIVRKRLTTSPENKHIWVEGIGDIYDLNILSTPVPTCDEEPSYCVFYECRKDGEVIFTYDDFFAPSYDISGVDEVAGEMPLSLQVPQGQICVKAGSQTTVCLRVFSVDGSEVAVAEGKGRVSVPTASFDPGVYVARAVGGGETRTLKWVQ